MKALPLAGQSPGPCNSSMGWLPAALRAPRRGNARCVARLRHSLALGVSYWGCLGATLLTLLSSSIATGCAHTIKETAKEAAPAAVDATVKQVHKADTRERFADLLRDPDIREATSRFSESVVDGALDAMTEAQRTARLNAIADGLVTSVAFAMARSWRDQLGPEFSRSMASVVERSVAEAFNANTEQRVAAMAEAVAEGTVKGFGRAMIDDSGKLAPALVAAAGDLARGVTHDVAFGFHDAVADARERRDVGASPKGDVLGPMGKAADVSFWAMPLAVWGFLALGFGVVVAIGWMIYELIRLRRISSELRLQSRGA